MISRCRPPTKKEIDNHGSEALCVTFPNVNEVAVFNTEKNREKVWEFDEVFDTSSTQEAVYKGEESSMSFYLAFHFLFFSSFMCFFLLLLPLHSCFPSACTPSLFRVISIFLSYFVHFLSYLHKTIFPDVSALVVSVLDGYNVCIFAYGQTGSGKTWTMSGPATNRGVNTRALDELFERTQVRMEVQSIQPADVINSTILLSIFKYETGGSSYQLLLGYNSIQLNSIR